MTTDGTLPIPDITIRFPFDLDEGDDGMCEMTLAEYMAMCNMDLYPGSDEAAIAALAVGESVPLGGGASPEYTITRVA